MDWLATSWRPNPTDVETVHEVILGRGFSTKKDTINIQLDAFPITDDDSMCRVIIRSVDSSKLDSDWPKKWTVLSYKTDRNGATKKIILGSAWLDENEIVVYLDALPTPNQNIECWLTIKPKIERKPHVQAD